MNCAPDCIFRGDEGKVKLSRRLPANAVALFIPAVGDSTIAPAHHRGINWMVRAIPAVTT